MSQAQAGEKIHCENEVIESSYSFGKNTINTKAISTKEDLIFDMSIRPRLIRLVNVAPLMKFTEVVNEEWAIFTFSQEEEYADMRSLVGATAIGVRLSSLGEIKYGQSLFDSTDCIEYLGTETFENDKDNQITAFLLYKNVGGYAGSSRRLAKN